MDIPGLGVVTKDVEFHWYRSQPVPIPVLGGKICQIVVEGYDDDSNKDELHAAIANFLAIDSSVLTEAAPHVFQYYQDCKEDWAPDDDEYGLQIVFKNGLKVNKVGPYDGHLTNSDVYADDSLEDVVYRRH